MPDDDGVTVIFFCPLTTTGVAELLDQLAELTPGLSCSTKPVEGFGHETITLFVLCCLWPDWFGVLAYIYAALCAITTATRIKAGWDDFAR